MASPEEHLAKAERFLATARWALGDGDPDSCASRAEYAAHHAMVALLLQNGASATIATASKPKIQTDFANLARRRYSEIERLSFGKSNRNLRKSLGDLSALRNEADYDVPNVMRQDAIDALQFARRITELVRQAL